MNKKFKNFLKLPLLITSGVLALVGLVVIVVYACLPVAHSKYTGTSTEGNTTIKLEYTFKGDRLYFKSFVDGKEADSEDWKFTVKDGKLYLGEYSKLNPAVADINAYSLKPLGNEDLELVNHTAKALTGVSIALLVVGLLGVAGSVTFMIVDKKKKRK